MIGFTEGSNLKSTIPQTKIKITGPMMWPALIYPLRLHSSELTRFSASRHWLFVCPLFIAAEQKAALKFVLQWRVMVST